MKLSVKKLSLCVAVVGCMNYANAANPIELANRENDRLQQNIQERQKYEQQQLLQLSKQPTRIEAEAPTILGKNEGPCFEIQKILVLGNEVLKNKTIEAITAPHIHSCMNVHAIEVLMSQVTAAYLNKGYVAARVYLPEQDLNSGELKLQIEEGHLAGLQTTERAKGTLSLATALGNVKGKPLNLRDLEQAIDQINRLQSNNAKMEILPGEQAGESIVIFDNTPAKRLNGYFSYDNKGQDSTGKNQGSLGLSLDNPLGLNDLIGLTYNRSLPFSINQTDSYSASVMYVVPFGYNTLNLNASRSEYDSTLDTGFNQLVSHGETTTYSARLDRLMYRGLNSQLRVNAALTSKDTEAFLENIKLGVSSRKLSVLDVGMSYSDRLFSGLVNMNLGYFKGLKAFNALEDAANLPADMPKAQFEKLTYGIGYLKGFNWLGQSLSFSTSFSGQYAFDPLYGSEQYSIGSLYNVRGFNQNTLSGDQGYALKNDLTLNKAYDIGGTTVYARHVLGLDYGKVDNKTNSNYVGELSSVSLSTTFNVSNVSLELIATQPIHQENFMKKQSAELFFSTTFSF